LLGDSYSGSEGTPRQLRDGERQCAGEAGQGPHLHQQGCDPSLRGEEKSGRGPLAELRL